MLVILVRIELSVTKAARLAVYVDVVSSARKQKVNTAIRAPREVTFMLHTQSGRGRKLFSKVDKGFEDVHEGLVPAPLSSVHTCQTASGFVLSSSWTLGCLGANPPYARSMISRRGFIHLTIDCIQHPSHKGNARHGCKVRVNCGTAASTATHL